MSKLCTKTSSFFYMAAVLGLVACGGQDIKPEADTAVEAEPAMVVPEPVVEVQPEPEPEPEPVVEVMPQKQVEEAKIAVEPIPAKAVSDEGEKTSLASAEPEKKEQTRDMSAQAADNVSNEPVKESASKDKQVSAKKALPVADAEAPVVQPKEEATLTLPKKPNHFVVTVGPKQETHPAFGKGHKLGFLVDGVSGKELVVERGTLYTFDILTDPKHDVYLSKKAVGWGGAPYVKGVEGAYTYKGTMTLKADKDTPEYLFYACRNHPYMGGPIHVVNKGEKVDIKQQVSAKKAAGGAVATKAATVTQSKVKQKLMFAEMMAGATGTKRVLASQNDEAKQLVVGAKKKLAEGREKSLVGALPEALALANESLKMLSEATRLVPGDEELAQMAESYKTMIAEIHDYQKSYSSNIKRMEKNGGVPDDARMDEKKMASLLTEAKSLAEKKNYVRANKLLQEAQRTITSALHKMLDSKTIVYDLKFDTPADEYEYELKRFTGYEELIPVAIEAKKPAAGAIKLMESFLSKARNRRDEAIAKADAGDYPTAIAMLLQATKTVRRALRMVGVSQ